MEILWLSESGFDGKVPRDFNQMRTEFAWFAASDGVHKNIGDILNIKEQYDVAIIILPKNESILQQISTYSGFDLIGSMRKVAKKIGYMQEGPVKFYQDYSIPIQVWWFGVLQQMDFLMAHNKLDAHYLQAMFEDQTVFVNRSLIIEDAIDKDSIETKERKDSIIGGNLCSWYGGWDSYMVANTFEGKIHAPQMGRMPKEELQIDGLEHLPYMTWTEWMTALSKFKFAVHLMPTHAAGTFALNCSYLNLPCIGFENLDTQDILHKETTVKMNDIKAAKKIAFELTYNEQFYKEMSDKTKEMYNLIYTEETWKENFFNNMELIANE